MKPTANIQAGRESAVLFAVVVLVATLYFHLILEVPILDRTLLFAYCTSLAAAMTTGYLLGRWYASTARFPILAAMAVAAGTLLVAVLFVGIFIAIGNVYWRVDGPVPPSRDASDLFEYWLVGSLGFATTAALPLVLGAPLGIGLLYWRHRPSLNAI